EVPVLGSLEEPRQVLDSVVLFDAVGEHLPVETLLAQGLVLRVDDDQGRVLSVQDQRRGPPGRLLRGRGTLLRSTLPLPEDQSRSGRDAGLEAASPAESLVHGVGPALCQVSLIRELVHGPSPRWNREADETWPARHESSGAKLAVQVWSDRSGRWTR